MPGHAECEEIDPDEELVVLEDEPAEPPTWGEGSGGPRLSGGKRRRPPSPAAAKPLDEERRSFTPAQRLLILDCWQRSALPAPDFAPLVGLSPAALYKWKRLFEQHGPAGTGSEDRRSPDMLPWTDRMGDLHNVIVRSPKDPPSVGTSEGY